MRVSHPNLVRIPVERRGLGLKRWLVTGGGAFAKAEDPDPLIAAIKQLRRLCRRKPVWAPSFDGDAGWGWVLWASQTTPRTAVIPAKAGTHSADGVLLFNGLGKGSEETWIETPA
jgi:hypothetical protein